MGMQNISYIDTSSIPLHSETKNDNITRENFRGHECIYSKENPHKCEMKSITAISFYFSDFASSHVDQKNINDMQKSILSNVSIKSCMPWNEKAPTHMCIYDDKRGRNNITPHLCESYSQCGHCLPFEYIKRIENKSNDLFKVKVIKSNINFCPKDVRPPRCNNMRTRSRGSIEIVCTTG